jgi:hemerythrin-like domain-containing protein
MENKTTVNEDLMMEHALLNRILLIYDEIVDRLKNKKEFYANIILVAAYIIRSFIEDYHEKIEEQYIFPVLLKHNKHNDLINELTEQHKIGRRLTDQIIILSMIEPNDINSVMLADFIERFVQMYRYHETREETIIFPQFKELVTKKEYDRYEEFFDKTEDELFGPDAYEKNLKIIERLEQMLDIYDINKQSQMAKKLLKENL